MSQQDEKALLKAWHDFRLRIITNEHVCGGGLHPMRPPFNHMVCEAFRYSVLDPRHFVRKSVARIGRIADSEVWQAWSDEGDMCAGTPGDLLQRLTEWERVS
jgi:hypothetical protein